MSQENVSDKVRNLQRQIAQSIKFGQKPPSSLRRSEGDECSSDEEEVPRSPVRVMAQVETVTEAADNEAKAQAAHATPVKSPRIKRVLPPEGTIESINLDAVPQSGPRLDNAAAKHKLSVKPKNQRVSRKHRRFTQELQEANLPGVLQEETDAQGAAEESVVPHKASKKQRLHEDELEKLEVRHRREQEEEWLREERRAEELRLMEERRIKLKEEREKLRREEEERVKREEEERIRRDLEEKRRKEEEEWRFREEQERKVREEEERKKREEDRRRTEEEERRRLEAERIRLEEERRILEEEEAARKKREEEEKQQKLKEQEEKQRREEEERMHEEERRQLQAMEAEKKRLAVEEEDRRRKKEEEEKKRQQEERERAYKGSEIEWKRKAEELRWKEMEERQPFSFKVSSGEKQILFQKVNLTPVTPGSPQQTATSSEPGEGAGASSPGGGDSPTLSSIYVPHTAILVTGAQLCGTAVNLDQIKDTACKSLLGLAEDKKAMVTPTKNKTSPDRKSGKTKSLNLSSTPTDQASASVLAEWASIRSKIFKGVEEGKYEDYQEAAFSRKENQSPTSSEELSQSPFPHPNLRKTLSASAKFSITPAKKKFGDSNRNSDILSPEERPESVSPEPLPSGPSPPSSSSSSSKPQSTKGTKSVRISDSSEECMFAKDLPSFLVPTSNQGSSVSPRPEVDILSHADSEGSCSEVMDDGDQRELGGDERPSPFGIKLRRTNYSLRFHSEQSSEKRKKRYSAGDSFDGVPGPLTPMDSGSDSSALSERSSPASPLRESAGIKPVVSPSVESQMRLSRSPAPSLHSEGERFSKPPVYQKPTTPPKPSSGVTPPPSPLVKKNRAFPLGDTGGHRRGSPQPLSEDERSSTKEVETSAVSMSPKVSPADDEAKEKKSFFPSISIPWREKADRKTELSRKEKPSLQSRHSLDSPKVSDKEAGPLWITLALQKQKGFREQQQTREERKNQREAKFAEKQSKERDSGVVSPTGSKGHRSTPKPQTPEEGKRPESLLGRFERRENLKKANTLPSSVTVEITDSTPSTPSPPAVKELSKRFPPGDGQQVSTEPAWLALAKRKAKAWSDCPQIIK